MHFLFFAETRHDYHGHCCCFFRWFVCVLLGVFACALSSSFLLWVVGCFCFPTSCIYVDIPRVRRTIHISCAVKELTCRADPCKCLHLFALAISAPLSLPVQLGGAFRCCECACLCVLVRNPVAGCCFRAFPVMGVPALSFLPCALSPFCFYSPLLHTHRPII